MWRCILGDDVNMPATAIAGSDATRDIDCGVGLYIRVRLVALFGSCPQ